MLLAVMCPRLLLWLSRSDILMLIGYGAIAAARLARTAEAAAEAQEAEAGQAPRGRNSEILTAIRSTCY